jgi:hypothetical protein
MAVILVATGSLQDESVPCADLWPVDARWRFSSLKKLRLLICRAGDYRRFAGRNFTLGRPRKSLFCPHDCVVKLGCGKDHTVGHRQF